MPPARPSDRREPRSVLITAAWAGATPALTASVIAIVAVAVLWLPASSGSGSAGSAIRAGIITFLAGVHGGVTVDGVPAGFVPLGLTAIVVVLIWRAATAVAEQAPERPIELVQAAATQSIVFALTCTVLAASSGLGTSSASVGGAFGAGLLLAGLTSGAAMLRPLTRDVVPAWVTVGLRAATAALAVYLTAGALLVAGALAAHYDRVTALSDEVGGGWSGVPVLVLGVLAAPNAVIAGAGYLSGAGFAVGTATTASLTATNVGLVPAFPLLGALPGPGGATFAGWLLAAVTPLAAGAVVAVVTRRAPIWRERWTNAGAAVAGVAVLGAALAWQGGGGIGSGTLRAVGTSPWQFALLTAAWVALATALWFGARAGAVALRGVRDDDTSLPAAVMRIVRDEPASDVAETADDAADREQPDDAERPDHLAG